MALRYPLVLNGTTIEELQSADSLDVTSASISGDLTFTGTGARVKANFSDPIANNRLLFQTSAANSTTAVGIAPSGTGSTAIIYGVNNSDLTNASYFDLRVSGSGNDVRLTSDYFGAGSYLPITFYTGGLEQVRITANSGGPANFQFSQSGTRVIGDFSNPIASNRVLFQTSTANSTTAVGIMPSGTGSTSIIYGTNSSTLTNASYFDLRVSGSGNDVRLTSDYYGAGTYLPITFYTGGSERVRLDTSGNFSIAGLTASRALATDASKNLVSSTVTSTELGYLSGVTSAIQTQLNSKAGTADANTFTNNQSISVNSASDALRITQTGAGNALVVEDSANPDSTPFVIAADGAIGHGTATPTSFVASDGFVQKSAFAFGPTLMQINSVAGASAAYVIQRKDRNGAIVQSGDALGNYSIGGYDGASYLTAAAITAFVDGTPGTNDMPGRLVFSTTADGASSPTERMRIDSAGRVGVGTTPISSTAIVLGKNITGGANAYGVYVNSSIQSDVTTSAQIFSSYPTTQATTFTLGSLIHYAANQNTLGAGATVTNQIGFYAYSGLTGATNNFGFYSNIASGSGRYNFYAAGTADNYFAGSVGIGSTPGASTTIQITKALTGGAAAYGILLQPTIQSDVVSNAFGFITAMSTQAASFALGSVRHFQAQQGSIGAGSAVTSQFGFLADSSLTGATNNYGFYSNIASGSGRYNFYAAGTADNYFAGAVGIGVTSLAGFNIYSNRALTGATTASSFQTAGPVQSDVTTEARSYASFLQTSGATFSLGTATHYHTQQGSFTSATVTNQIGFRADASLTGATNNFGFYSNIASGTGRFNFYAAGTADNYFAGSVAIGSTASNASFYNARLITGAVNAYGNRLVATGDSTVTNTLYGYGSALATSATAYTLATATHFAALGTSVGAGSTITNQYGFFVDSSLTGATNNFGVYSNIASGSNRYNFYAAGTAANYFAGNVGIGGDASVSFETFASATNWIRNNSAAGIPIFAAYKSNGTISSKTIVASGDEVGRFDIRGYDGANFVQLAQIGGFVDGTPGTNDMPGRLVFSTTADGASSPTERMRIDNAGNIYGTSGTTAMANGFFYIPSAAGAPSGVPTAVSGRVPMYYDTTNNNFYVYNGAWKKVLLT